MDWRTGNNTAGVLRLRDDAKNSVFWPLYCNLVIKKILDLDWLIQIQIQSI
jgi:hypothetical protein